MKRRVSGFFAWGALALLIAVPSSEALLKLPLPTLNAAQVGQDSIAALDVALETADASQAPLSQTSQGSFVREILGPPIPAQLDDAAVPIVSEEVVQSTPRKLLYSAAAPVPDDLLPVVFGAGVDDFDLFPPTLVAAEGQRQVGAGIMDYANPMTSHSIPEPSSEISSVPDLLAVAKLPYPAPRIAVRPHTVVAGVETNSTHGDQLQSFEVGQIQRIADRGDVWRTRPIHRSAPNVSQPGSTDYLPVRRGRGVRFDLLR